MPPATLIAALDLATAGLPAPWNTIGLVISALITLGIFAGLFVTSHQLSHRALLKKEAFERIQAAYDSELQSIAYEIDTPVRALPAPTPEAAPAPEATPEAPAPAPAKKKKPAKKAEAAEQPAEAPAETPAAAEPPKTKRTTKPATTRPKQPTQADA